MLGHSPLASRALGGSSLAHYTFIAGSATFVFTGNAAELDAGARLTAGTATYSLSGQDARLLRPVIMQADGATYEYQGYPTIQAGAYILTALRPQFNYYGQDAGLYADRTVTASVGTFVTITPDVGFRDDFQPAHGAYALAGQSATLRAARRISAANATYTAVGIGPEGTVVITLAPDPGAYRLTAGETQFHFAYELRRSVTVSEIGFRYTLDDPITTAGR